MVVRLRVWVIVGCSSVFGGEKGWKRFLGIVRVGGGFLWWESFEYVCRFSGRRSFYRGKFWRFRRDRIIDRGFRRGGFSI